VTRVSRSDETEDSMNDDMWSYIHGLREDLSKAESRIWDLEQRISRFDQQPTIDTLTEKIAGLEADRARLIAENM
jgi:hypothetical protein